MKKLSRSGGDGSKTKIKIQSDIKNIRKTGRRFWKRIFFLRNRKLEEKSRTGMIEKRKKSQNYERQGCKQYMNNNNNTGPGGNYIINSRYLFVFH